MRLFEQRGEARGCRTFYLEKFSFQAPGLYRSLGYEEKLALQGFGPGIVKYILVREASGHQGNDARTSGTRPPGAGASARGSDP